MQEIKIAIYMRVSTQRQADSRLGLEAQERGIKNWISTKYPNNQYNTIVEYFIDDGITGSKFDRKQLQKMLSKISKNEFDVCLIYKVDRLARDVEISSKIAKIVRKSKCELYSTSESFDLNTTEGTFIYNMQSIFGEHERMLIAKRTEDSQISRLNKGEYPFTPPFGYKRDPSTKKLEIVSSEEKIVKFIFDYYLKCHNIREVSREIDIVFYLKKSDLFVEGILRKYLYTGNYIKKGIEYFDVAPAIITKEIFSKVEYQLLCLHKVKRGENYLFNDNVFCSRCNCRASRTSSFKKRKLRYYYYQCTTCRRNVNVEYIENKVILEFKFEINKLDQKDKLIKQYKRKLASYEYRKKEIVKYYVDEKISLNDYEDMKKVIDEKINSIRNKMSSKLIVDYTSMNAEQKFFFFQEYISKIEIDFKFKEITNIEFKNIDKYK